ncbi:4-carboxymuconolactone decarboxylase [Mycolicibacterium porcinum]|nr:4-carboxymuconolactone decarboxylase [Mycolicibacterium porcinum]
MSALEPARIAPGGFRELGPVNWAIAKLGARAIRAPRFTLMNVLGQHKLLFLAWLPYSGLLLGPLGKLPRQDAELVILRVGHLRDCEYELQQHRRLARSRGVTAETQARIFEGPDAEGLTERQRVLITATDEFVVTRSISAETWAALSVIFTKQQLIEFCMLASQYDGLAATMTTLRIPLDFPD